MEVFCNATGSPDPTIIWRKVQGDGYNSTEGKLLNITNITRAQAGKYNCTANNTCGEEFKVMNIDVQCKSICFLFNAKNMQLIKVNRLISGRVHLYRVQYTTVLNWSCSTCVGHAVVGKKKEAVEV